jgi:hypothetical protein
MKKYHIHTTISEKHMALLNRLTEKYETQQKALEKALESLESNPQADAPQSIEDRIWAQSGKDFKKVIVIMHRDSYKNLLDYADIEQFIGYMSKDIPMKSFIEYVSGKPLREMTLKELLDAVTVKVKIQNTADMINYTDDGDHYTLVITHGLGLNHSKVLKVGKESLFNSYGARTESEVTEKSVFVKIYKNER